MGEFIALPKHTPNNVRTHAPHRPTRYLRWSLKKTLRFYTLAQQASLTPVISGRVGARLAWQYPALLVYQLCHVVSHTLPNSKLCLSVCVTLTI